MHWNADAWLAALERVTLMVAASAGLVALLLAMLRVRSASLQRLACAIVLLQGWLLAQVPVELEREAPPPAERVADVADTSLRYILPDRNMDIALPIAAVPRADELSPRPESQSDAATVPYNVPVAPESPAFAISWKDAVFGVWIAGAVLTLILGVRRYATFLQMIRSTVAPPGEWQAEFESTRSGLGIAGQVALRVSDDVGPCLVRRRRESCVVVPRSLWSQLAPPQRVAILRHELAHYVRGDLWKSMAMRLLAAPQWFNPAAWWAVRRFDECAEWACDQVAAGEGAAATEYSKLLLLLGTAPPGHIASLPAAHSGCMATRIRRLVAKPRRDGRAAWWVVALVVVGLLAVSLLRIDVVEPPSRTLPDVAGALSAIDGPSPMPWHPDDLVAVLGDERGHVWNHPLGLAVTTDGSRLITAGNGALIIYDAHTMASIATFGEQRSAPRHLQIAGGGGVLIVGCNDQTIDLWDIAQAPPELIQTVRLPAGNPEPMWLQYASARNADRIVACAGQQISIWELRQRRLDQVHSFTVEEFPGNCLLSPDGDWLLTKSTRMPAVQHTFEVGGASYTRADCVLRVWDISGGNARETDQVVTTDIQSPMFSPDGTAFHAEPGMTELNRGRRLWTFSDGKLHEEPDVPVDFGTPDAIAFSPDGRFLAGTPLNSVGRVVVMDISQNPWQEVASLDTKAPYLTDITFTPDGEALMLCGGCSLQRWNRMDDGSFERVTPEPVHSGNIEDLYFSEDGSRLTSSGGTSICEWDLLHLNSEPPRVSDMDGMRVGAMAPMPGRDAFAVQDSGPHQRVQLREWTNRSLQEKWSISAGDDYGHDAWCLAIDPHRRLLATGHRDSAIRFWNIEGPVPVKTAELKAAHSGHVCDLAFSPDGMMLASVGWHGSVKLWDMSTDPPSAGGVLGKHDATARSVAFSPDGRWLASGDELGVIRLWDLESKDLTTLRHLDDGTPPTSRPFVQRTVMTLEFSADNDRLLSADGAGRVTVWSVPSREIIKEWNFPGWVWVARWSPDERLIATGNANGTVYLLRAPSAE